jgi:hypothetical protein
MPWRKVEKLNPSSWLAFCDAMAKRELVKILLKSLLRKGGGIILLHKGGN